MLTLLSSAKLLSRVYTPSPQSYYHVFTLLLLSLMQQLLTAQKDSDSKKWEKKKKDNAKFLAEKVNIYLFCFENYFKTFIY